MKRLFALACLWLCASSPAFAADPEIAFDEFYLDNGLRVVVHEDHKAPIVAVTIWYHVGSKNEVPGKTGFAHLFEHLMFNGSENHNDEYFRPFQEIGATSMNGTTDIDRTNYFETVPSTGVDLALWMESDRMGHLLGAIDQDKLDEQRGVVQNEKRQGDNQPYGKVLEQIVSNLFPPGHPYSWDTIGSMDDLNAASLDDVKRWFQTYYGPNNATLVLAGDIDVATAKEKVQHFFGDIPPGPPLNTRDRWIPNEVPASRIIMQDRVPEARLYKVWRGPEWRSDDTTLMELVDAVLDVGQDVAALQAPRLRRSDRDRRGRVLAHGRDRGRVHRLRDRGGRERHPEGRRACSTRSSRASSATARPARSSSACAPRSRVRSSAASSKSAASAASRTSSRKMPCSAAGPTSTSIRSTC